MHLALSADIVVPLGAGVVALAIAVYVVLRRREGEDADAAGSAPDAESSRTVAEELARRSAGEPTPADRAAAASPVTGSGESARPRRELGSALAGAFAARAAAARQGEARAAAAKQDASRAAATQGASRAAAAQGESRAAAAPQSEARQPPPPPAPDGDTRDRLLAVLLDDPLRALRATVELETCCEQLDRLTAALRHERAVLGDVVHRLASAGLRPEQLARLASLPVDEVRALLDASGVARS